MLRKTTSFVALGVITAAIATATTPVGQAVTQLLRSVVPQGTLLSAGTANPTDEAKSTVDIDALNAEAQQTLVGAKESPNYVELQTAEGLEPTLLGELGPERLTFATAEQLAQYKRLHPAKATTKSASAVIKTGEMIEVDHLTSGTNNGFHTVLSATDSCYHISNIYSVGDTLGINLTIDAEAGTVSIPRQVVYTHATYGEVSFIGLVTLNNKIYMTSNPVSGTIDADGKISIGQWGLVISDSSSKYYGGTFALCSGSEWNVPNATATGYNMTSGESETYSLYIEQSSDIVTSLYCLTPAPAEFTGRLSSAKILELPSQKAYTNAYYGDFNIFPATWSDATGVWKASVDTKNSLYFSYDLSGNLAIDGWVVSAKDYPSTYVAYKYRDFKIATSAITWPEAAKLSFEGQGTADAPYLIKSADDVTLLSRLVAEGNSFQGTQFALASDIDLSGIEAKNFIPVGDASHPFEGSFDGQSHAIKNLSMNGGSFTNTGLFGYLGENAVVKNLTLTNLKGVSAGSNLGAIAGNNEGTITGCSVSATLDSDGNCVGGIAGLSTGTISGCDFYGVIYGTGSAAGIVGQTSGTVEGCWAKVAITTDGYAGLSCHDNAGIAGVITKGSIRNCWSTGVLNESYGRSSTGGIAGRCLNSTIENCFSSAFISAKRSYTDSSGGGDTYTGGILGYISNSTMTNCYSSSTIVKSGTSDYCGGVVGYLGVVYASSTAYEGYRMNNTSDISNCFYTGYINSSSTTALKPMFGTTYYYTNWTGEDPDKICFKNCYYDKQVNTVGEDFYGRPTSFFTNGLPEGFSADVWEAKPGYYPTLKSVGAGTQAQTLASAPLLLRDGQTASKVKVGFSVTPADNITWALYGATDNETDALQMSGNDVTVKSIYAASQVQATSADGMSLKTYQLQIVPKLFDGEGTADDPYQLKSVADLLTLHSAVAEHAQTHTGDYFALTNDIDCTTADDATAFQGIGYGSGNAFGGSLDGQGHTIKNLSIDALVSDDSGSATTNSLSYCGFVGILTSDGAVKNLIIDKSCRFSFYRYSAPVVGLSYGLVDNCRNYADVTSVSTYNAGVVGIVSGDNGVISNCYNAGRISGGSTTVGGITAHNAGKVMLCQNDGDLIAESNNPSNAKTTQSLFGGIAAYNYGSIELCVNNGQVKADNSVGGITGRNAGGSITGSLNNGLVSSGTTSYRGAIIGYQQSLGTIANNYYDASININGASHNTLLDGITGLSTSELVAGVCPDELKALGAEEVFDFTANSYPVLKQFASEEAAQTLRTMYVAFTPGQLRSNVTADLALSPAEAITWSLADNAYFRLDGRKLVITMPTDTVPTIELTATAGNAVKSYELTSVPVIFAGSGTEASPYLIETPADWNKLSDFIAKSNWEYKDQYFKLTNDLDFAGDSIRVIAYNGLAFRGVIDGAGHTVKNYVYGNANATATKISGPNLYRGCLIGLFGTLGSEGVVKNFTFNGDFKAYSQSAGIVGYCYGKLENITQKGTVTTTGGNLVAGIAYNVFAGGSLTDCVFEGIVTSKTTTACGIAYNTAAGSTLTRCYNRGNVVATTTIASGIAYKVAGGLIDCGNENPLTGTATLTGIANTLDSTAYAIRCYNTADLGESGKSTICGLFNTLTARYNSKAPEVVPQGGYVEDCYNTGAIDAKDYGNGLFYKVNSGWTLTNCYNTGDVTSAGLACGLGTTLAGGSTEFLSVADHCYNTGRISGNKAATAGLFSEGATYSKLTYCYNTGDVDNSLKNGLTTGGLIGKFNGYMDHCFNAGNVTSAGNATGGLVGYVSYGKSDYPGRILNSFNLGNVTEDGFTGASINGNAGGLAGYLATGNATFWVEIENCFNAGTVKGQIYVGGLAGGSFQSYHVIRNCYNSGKVESDPDSNGVYYQSATLHTQKEDYQVCLQNCYYDQSATTIADRYASSAIGLTTSQFKTAEIGDAFEASAIGGYPTLKGFDGETTALAAGKAAEIMILVSDEAAQSHSNITDAVSLIAPEGTTWGVYEVNASGILIKSQKMTVEGNIATPTEEGDVLLIATTPDELSRTFRLTLKPTATGVKGITDGKTIESIIYVDVQGRIVAHPTPGNVYVVRTNYTDGTSTVVKVVAK